MGPDAPDRRNPPLALHSKNKNLDLKTKPPMIINWIGRALGWNDPNGSAASAHPAVQLVDGASPALSSFVDSDELAAELARARRYERDLAIAVLSTRPLRRAEAGNGESPTPSNLPQVLALMSAVALREILRQSDVVCFQAARNRFVLGLPESNGEDASRALLRIRSHFRTRLRLRVKTGLARFPADALTLEELITAAEARAELGTAPSRLNGHGHAAPLVSVETSSDESIASNGRKS
jgi:hypothetical protein